MVEVLVNPITNTVETFNGIQDLPTAILNEQPPGIILNFTDFFKNNFTKKFLFQISNCHVTFPQEIKNVQKLQAVLQFVQHLKENRFHVKNHSQWEN